MELRHLRYFVVLAEELHFGRAAQRLGISQPPLSQQILALERALDARLLERTNRRVELTEAGRVFLVEARATLDQAERAAAIVGRSQRGEVGELKIGFAPSAPFIAPFMKTILAFRQTRPDIRLVLEELVTPQQIDALAERRLHIGFIRKPAFPDLPDQLAAVELYREPLAVVLRADHRLAARHQDGAALLKALASEPFVFFPRESGTSLYDQVVALCRKAGFRPRIEQEARANSTILGLVAAGLGASVLPASLQAIAVENVAYRALSAADAKSSIWLVHRRHDQSPASRAFVALAMSNRAECDPKDAQGPRVRGGERMGRRRRLQS
jgi:DNA-binding transcriptional LysR family regulator